MYGNVFYEQLEIKADKPIDKRMYIDSLTVANLKLLFEDDGKYSFLNNIIFNKADKKFYYLATRATPADAVDPAKWTALQSSANGFVLYASANTYNIGDCVYQIDGGSNKRFFIAKEAIAVNEAPLTTSAKWLEVSGSGNNWQRYEHRLNPAVPAGNTTRTFDVSVISDLSNGHSPIVKFYCDKNVKISGQVAWQEIIPFYQIFTDGGVTKIRVTFSGDLTDIYYDGGNATQKNIIAEIR
ncbi:hypothetical protein HYO65_gp029 [Tenacibaculum phage PTm1]|uniref:Uncharacterized protein n=2 Tax=Shirahamavirus PTm1 TaxID=2846435 RepID=A0A5S9HXG1_9CAUD|nr:hypothetical protein HYO65_gp029 [Tenacibaculum phage PTm1]BBI90421.1 hypothetical protein [Tenacibaculum phage PTm1]BBI90728.1 hypothetical protein [Tenacibaculum phage PTm5]